jgi:hypothetical protein
MGNSGISGPRACISGVQELAWLFARVELTKFDEKFRVGWDVVRECLWGIHCLCLYYVIFIEKGVDLCISFRIQ